MSRHFCPCCGKESVRSLTCCSACHIKQVTDIERRKALPPGQKQEDEPIPEVSSGQLFQPRPHQMALCAGCGKFLPVRGHILGKPYCMACLQTTNPTWGVSGRSDEPSPSQENAIRRMEDCDGR